MDINRLHTKRQLNVQEQNALEKSSIMEVAKSYLAKELHTAWVSDALKSKAINSDLGILIKVSSTPCGGNEQSSYATWLTVDEQFYEIEATTILDSYELVSVDVIDNSSEVVEISSHLRGKGKSFGQLSLEILNELSK